MKITLSVSRKAGLANFGSTGATAQAEVELPQDLLSSPELATRVAAIYATLESCVAAQLQRSTEPAAGRPLGREPGADDDYDPQDDVGPGDRGYRRPPQPEPARRQSDRQPDRDRSSYGRPADDDLPRGPKQFLGWLGRQSKEDQDRVRHIARSWGLNSLYRSWSDDEVESVVNELLREPAGSRNGHHR
jgi:hypothetical protein